MSINFKYKVAFSLLVLIFDFTFINAQTVTNGSVSGGPVGNSQIQNASSWIDCGGSADLCDVSFPSYSGNSSVAVAPSPDGGTWAGIASISAGECASTSITGLTVGQTYTLYFCGANFGSGTSIFNGSPATPRVCVGATCQTYSIPMVASTWNSYSLTFTATASTLTLELFYSSSNNFAYASLDGFNLVSPCGNPTPVATQNDTICQGESSTLSATGGNGTFSWYPVGNSGNIISTGNSVTVSPSTTTSYVVTDGFTSDTATVVVFPIFADAGNDTTICIGNSVVLGGILSGPSGATFNWTPNSGLNASNIANPTATPSLSQLYILQVDNGLCTAFDSVLINVNTDTTTFDTFYICPGEGINIHGNFETVEGNYSQLYASTYGCDSVSNVELVIVPIVDSTINVSICDGETFFAGGTNQNTSGVYIDTFVSSIGCDSIITTILEVLPIAFSNDTITICQGDSIFIGGAFQSIAGTYFDTLTAFNFCDSIHTTFLSVVNEVLSFDTFEICQGDQIIIHGSFQNNEGLYLDTLIADNGCDSISSIYLSILLPINDSIFVDICNGESYFAEGSFQNSAGIYTDTLLSANSCDSIVTTFLNVLRTDTIDSTLVICDGESVTIHGVEQSNAGVYTFTYSNIVGCDSIVNVELLINPTYINIFNYDICIDDSVLVNGTYYNSSQIILDTFSSVSGCDSIIEHSINVKPLPEINLGEDFELCEGETQTISLDSIPLGYTLLWSDGTSNSSLTVEQGGIYFVSATDSTCYSISDSISVTLEDCTFYIYMPNAFSPNGDGINDIYIPIQNGEIEDYVMRIFDRWGELLFETRDIEIGWDGTLKGNDLNPGVYVWSIGYNTPDKVRLVKKGSLTLLR